MKALPPVINDIKTALDNLCILNDVKNSIRYLIKLAVKSEEDKEIILNRLYEIIDNYSRVVYMDTPNGLKEGEPEKYEEIIKAATVEQAAIQTVLGILGPNGLLDSERFTSVIDKSGMLERLGRWQDHISTMQKRATDVAEEFKKKYMDKTITKIKIFLVLNCYVIFFSLNIVNFRVA